MTRFFATLYLLCAASISWAQPRLSFNKETHFFGQIEWKKPVTVEYTVTNTGDRPLVLNNVTVSCACAVTDWTKNAIAPGEKGIIAATFDSKMLGHFAKSIGIYSNAEPHLMYLKFVGEVVDKVIDFSKIDFESIGDIYIDKTEIDFPSVHKGEQPKVKLTLINQSSTPYEPVLMHLPSYLSMERETHVLQKGEKGTITLRLNSDKLTDLGLTQTSVYLSRFSGDMVNEENEIPVSVVLLPDFSDMSEHELRSAPVVKLSETEIDLSAKLQKKKRVKYDVTITNVGHSYLHINKLQVFNPAIGLDLRKSMLKPGEHTHLRITVDKNTLKKKRKRVRVMMITNDPVNPKSEIVLLLEP